MPTSIVARGQVFLILASSSASSNGTTRGPDAGFLRAGLALDLDVTRR